MKLTACLSKFATASLIAATGLAAAATASADLSDLRGAWVNIDADTRGLTKVVIGGEGSVVSMSAWGSCSPSDCEWGAVPATPLTNSVSAAPETADRIVAVYEESFKMSILNAYRVGNKLVVDNATDFKDNRADTFHSYTFKRMPMVINPALINPALTNPLLLTPGIVQPTVTPPIGVNPAATNPLLNNPALLGMLQNKPVLVNPGVLPNRPLLDLSLLNQPTNLDQLEGVWKNVDADTKHITKLKVIVDGDRVKVKRWGSCTPIDCELPWVSGQPLTTTASAPATSANSVLATWNTGGAKRTIIMTHDNGLLTVQSTTIYNNGRSDRLNTFVFKK